jgi:hypothetical protein
VLRRPECYSRNQASNMLQVQLNQGQLWTNDSLREAGSYRTNDDTKMEESVQVIRIGIRGVSTRC